MSRGRAPLFATTSSPIAPRVAGVLVFFQKRQGQPLQMTALSKYKRLEASGLWRASPDAQRCDVVVSIGDATLIISDLRDRPLAHWSLAAIDRANPGAYPAIYHPDGSPDETLELDGSESEMIRAIEKLRAAIARQRPRPGRLRLGAFAISVAVVAAVVLIWLPDVARRHAVGVVPDVRRAEIGAALLDHVQKVTGPPCRGPGGRTVLAELGRRLPAPGRSGGPLLVVRDGVRDAIHLPGGTIVLGRALVEDHDDPDVVAGHIIAERLRAAQRDPLSDLLKASGTWSSFRLLATGTLPDDTLRAHAERLLTRHRAPLDTEPVLDAFQAASVRSTPYAYAQDVTGESTLGLIEADPFAGDTPDPILDDGDWLRLQTICGG